MRFYCTSTGPIGGLSHVKLKNYLVCSSLTDSPTLTPSLCVRMLGIPRRRISSPIQVSPSCVRGGGESFPHGRQRNGEYGLVLVEETATCLSVGVDYSSTFWLIMWKVNNQLSPLLFVKIHVNH